MNPLTKSFRNASAFDPLKGVQMKGRGQRQRLVIPDEKDLYFFTTVKYETYLSRMKGYNLPPEFNKDYIDLKKKMLMCDRAYLCVKGRMFERDVYVNVQDRKTFVPKSVIKDEIPLEIAREEFPQYFI